MATNKEGKSKVVEGEVIAKHPGGRPPKLTPEQRKEVYDAFEAYIGYTLDPKVVGFVSVDPTAIKYKVTKDNIQDWPEFSNLVKQAVAKQEWYLLEAGGTGRYNPTLAIFRLKQPQHGYKDRVDTDITTDGNAIQPLLVSFINNKVDVLPDGDNTDTD